VVSALGPWQQAQQRVCSLAYTGTVYGDAAIVDQLALNCDEISTDVSRIQATNVGIADLSWSNQPVADLVTLVCSAGNAAGQEMLFAIWEPTHRTTNGYPTSLLLNSNMEAGSGSLPTEWNFAQSTGDPAATWITSNYRSPTRAVKITRGGAAGDQEGYLWQSNIPCTAGTQYTFDYQVYWGGVASNNTHIYVAFYKADGSFISDAGTSHLSGSTAGWNRFIDVYTAPALAAHFNIRCKTRLVDGGANSYAIWDDVYVCATGATPAVDVKPRAYLWSLDLAGWDYRLYSKLLESGLDIDDSTRDLANDVVASYGSSNYTGWAADTASQGLYRVRQHVVEAGSVTATVAERMRDVHLALYANPTTEPAPFRLSRPGAVVGEHGGAVNPAILKAGDRLCLADGPQAGTVWLLDRVVYADGVVTCTPRRGADAALLLAS
jgi:hypothetical protein